jgi:hypothetical protein
LKTVHFKETIVLGNFLVCHQQFAYFFAALYLPQDGGSELFCSDGGGDPHTFFLKVPWVNKQLASSNFTLRKNLKVAGVKYGNNRAGRTSLRLFPLPIIENSGGMTAWPTAWQKKFCTDILGLLSPKTTLNLF